MRECKRQLVKPQSAPNDGETTNRFEDICDKISSLMRGFLSGIDSPFSEIASRALYYHLAFLVLSIHRWNESQVRFFADAHWTYLREAMSNVYAFIKHPRWQLMYIFKEELEDEHEVALATRRFEDIPLLMQFVLLQIHYKLKSKRLHAIHRQVKRCPYLGKARVAEHAHKRRMSMRNSLLLDLRETVTCGYEGCSTKQDVSKRIFKICSGCKIAYYCSSKCQKKAWKAHHRQTCSALKCKINL